MSEKMHDLGYSYDDYDRPVAEKPSKKKKPEKHYPSIYIDEPNRLKNFPELSDGDVVTVKIRKPEMSIRKSSGETKITSLSFQIEAISDPIKKDKKAEKSYEDSLDDLFKTPKKAK